MIKLGNQEFIPTGFEKVYRGSELMYQKKNKAPASTKVLQHFNNSLINSVSGTFGENQVVNSLSFVSGKFSEAVQGNFYFDETPTYTNEWLGTHQLTLEFWIKRTSGSNNYYTNFCTRGNSNYLFKATAIPGNGLQLQTGDYEVFKTCSVLDTLSSFDITQWHHIAVVVNNGNVNVYLDGTLVTTGTIRTTGSTPSTYGFLNFHVNTSYYAVDEFLICEEIKYNANFTPPTQPYDLYNTYTYQEVNYIEGTGTQYLCAGYKPTGSSNNFKIDCEAQFTDNLATYAIFGDYYSSSMKCDLVATTTNFQTNIVGVQNATPVCDTNKHRFRIESMKFYVDDNQYNIGSASNFNLDRYLLIMARNDTSIKWYAHLKLYYLKIYDGSTLVRDYVPVVRSDGSVGLLDKISNIFYGNEGTGTFNYG